MFRDTKIREPLRPRADGKRFSIESNVRFDNIVIVDFDQAIEIARLRGPDFERHLLAPPRDDALIEARNQGSCCAENLCNFNDFGDIHPQTLNNRCCGLVYGRVRYILRPA